MSNVRWLCEKLNFSESEKKDLLRYLLKNSEPEKLPKCADGDIFKIADIEFIKFPDNGDGTFCAVSKDILFSSTFGDNNNFAESNVLKILKKDWLPKIESAIGEDNVMTFKLDLTTLDGLTAYADLETKIGIPTLDFYRKNVSIFDKHKTKNWFWLATGYSTQPHYDPVWVECVSPRGNFNNDRFSNGNGVRPFCILRSSIFES